MASLKNLEIAVEVDISSAIASLEQLEEKLDDIADRIDKVDRKHIGITSSVNGISSELGQLTTQIELWEDANSIDISTNIRGTGIGGGGGGARVDSDGVPLGYTLPESAVEQVAKSITSNFSSGSFGGDRIPPSYDTGRTPSRLTKIRRSINKLIPNMENFNLSMSDIHNALARAVPLLITFIGTVPAVVATMYTLAAAAGAAAAGLIALGGLGALGVGLSGGGQFDAERLSDVLSDLRDSFIEAFAPLAERLEPLFVDAVDGLGQLFQSIANQGDVFMSFESDARAFGGFMMDFIPTFIRGMSAMANAFSSVFGDIGGFLQANFINILRGMTQTAVDALPAVASLAMTIADMIPPLIRLSTGFTLAARGVLQILGVIGKLLSFIPFSLEVIGAMTGTVLAAASAFFLLNSTILRTVGVAFASLARTILTKVAPALTTYVGNALTAIGVTQGLRAAVLSLMAVTGIGLLIGAVGTLGSQFLKAGNNIDKATESMEEFKNVASGATQSDFNRYGGDRTPSDAATAGGAGGVSRTTIVVTGNEDDDQSAEKKRRWKNSRPSGTTR